MKSRPLEFIGLMSSALEKSLKPLRKEITNIRYGELGEIRFDFRGKTATMAEPKEIVIVGVKGEYPKRFILRKILSGETSIDVRKLKKVM
jgi:hypothetical protein